MGRIIMSLTIFALAVSACSTLAQSPLPTADVPELGQTWILKMNHSGGIMGLSRSIEISSDGNYTVTDERTNSRLEGKLSAAELVKLSDLLATAISNPPPGGRNSACADCFIYTIEFKGAGTSFTAEVDDTTIAESGLEPLVNFVRGIMEKDLR